MSSRTVKEKILDNGYEDVIILENESYDSALIGISQDNRAIYSFEKMIQWLVEKDNISEEEAIEWIEYNTLRALPYFGSKAPIVMYNLY